MWRTIRPRCLGLDLLPNKIPKVKPNLGQHLGMLFGSIHAQRPYLTLLLRAAELPRQDDVECLYLLLGPLDAGAHHWRREAALEAVYRVADDGKVDKRQLPDVQVEVSLEDTLPGTLCQQE